MRSPFKLLDAYTAQDKNVFFGRDTEIDTLYTLIFKTNLLIVYGLSGTGKTSVIQCGLASRFDGPDWYPMYIRRNEDINVSLDQALVAALKSDAQEDVTANVAYLMRRTLRPVYLIFDQFEELFILGTHNEQEKFMHRLRHLLDAGLNAKVILVMREEYIGQLYAFEQVIPELFDFRFRVEPMGIAKVQTVIQESFDKFNIHLQEPKSELLQYMTEQISDPRSGIALPYLQVYLDMLYREVVRRQYGQTPPAEPLPRVEITKDDIKGLGRIDNVLEKFLSQQVKEITRILQGVFPDFPHNGMQFVLDPFATDEGTKRPVHYVRKDDQIELDAEIRKVMPVLPAHALTRALELLEHARILRVREDTIELAHDSLAAIVDRRRTDEQRQLQNVRRRLTNALEEFQKTGLYLNEKQLLSFEEYLPKLQLTDDLRKFIAGSEADISRQKYAERDRAEKEREAKQQRQLARVRGILLTMTLAFAAVAVGLGFRAQYNFTRAEERGIELDSVNTSLQHQFEVTSQQQKAIENILRNVQQQIVRLDSSVSAGQVTRIDLLKTLVSLKILTSNDTLTEEELRTNFARVSNIRTVTAKGQQRNEFFAGQSVVVSADVTPGQRNDLLQVSWFDQDNNVTGTPGYYEVKTGAASQMRISGTFPNVGRYTAKFYNSAGRVIDSTRFSIVEAPPTQFEVKPGNFKIVDRVTGSTPGTEVTSFRSNSTVYYWARIHSPLDEAQVDVVIEHNGKVVYERSWPIGRNEIDGYLLWDANARSFRSPGRYVVYIIDNRGIPIAKREFTMQ